MKNANDPHDDEDRLITPLNDYRTLLETTRPLMIAESGESQGGLFMYRDQPTSLETGDCDRESALKRGEIVHADASNETVTKHKGPAATIDLVISNSHLRIRIYLGMS